MTSSSYSGDPEDDGLTHEVNEVAIKEVPTGAMAMVGLAIGFLIFFYFLIYFTLFVPLGSAG
jgi:hypothetical protein